MSNPATISDSPPPIIRKLGKFESFYVAAYTLDIYCGTVMTCHYSIPSDLRGPAFHGKLVERWKLAIAETILQHPLLQVGLVNDKSGTPAWVHLDHVDLSQHIEWQVINDLEPHNEIFQQTMRHQLDTGFQDLATRPGWRLIVLRHGDLLDAMFVWNHCNSDGTGAKIFHQTLLKSLNNFKNNNRPCLNDCIVKTTTTMQNITPSQEVLAPYRITPGFAVASLWKLLKPPFLDPTSRSRADSDWGSIRSNPRKTQLRSLSIDNSTLQNVLSTCRAHSTTLTGLLHGIALLSLAPQLPVEWSATLTGETALDIRRFITPGPSGCAWSDPTQLLGNFLSKMEHEFKNSLLKKIAELRKTDSSDALEEVLWSVSATVRQQIEGKLNMGLNNDVVGLTWLIPDWRMYMKHQMKNPRASLWCVTNLGVIDGDSGTPSPRESSSGDTWSIQRSTFAVSAHVLSALFNIAIVSAKGGDLCIEVSWQDQIVETRVGEQLGADIEGWLGRIGSKVYVKE
ncbi:alcohol acetyltransferase-domain-containing protein [Dactylonectria macrodidyma]|uniref:Alcohol acetyltransferase-domain-containing protein n=1 Tax=Dactylonectria macrodidyma TaxID=307937 RepID=A0A9P9DBM6_9HYPO|nr:alcohol acetyltransferase-domain-containing protein [Dactylonectria macrodidyma]